MYCKFCYSKIERVNQKVELGFEEKKDFLLRNSSIIKSINFGTAENVLADDFFKLIRFIRTLNPSIKLSITTNGSVYNFLQNKKISKIFYNCIDEVDVSLDSANPSLHDSLRGVKGAFDMASKTIDECTKNDKVCTIVNTLMKPTASIDNVEGLIDLASKKNCLLRFNVYRPSNGSWEYVISCKELFSVIAFCLDNLQLLRVSDRALKAWLDIKEVTFGGSDISMRLLPDGWITFSTYLVSSKWHIGNIKSTSLRRIKNKIDRFLKYCDNILPQDCVDCHYKDTCKGGEIDRRLLWFGDLGKKDPYCPLEWHSLLPTSIRKNSANSLIHADYLPTIIFRA
jgi:radical SAM protein with 4Fe4S-binding SPASM domain